MPTFFVTRPIYLGGRWLSVGEKIDPVGFRRGAIKQMLADGLISADVASDVVSGDPVVTEPPPSDETDENYDPDQDFEYDDEPNEVVIDPGDDSPQHHVPVDRPTEIIIERPEDQNGRVIIIIEQDPENPENDVEFIGAPEAPTPENPNPAPPVIYLPQPPSSGLPAPGSNTFVPPGQGGVPPGLEAFPPGQVRWGPGEQTAIEFVTTDGGNTWHAVSPSITNFPPANYVSLGADGELYFSLNGEDWYSYGAIVEFDEHVTALTYSRKQFVAATNKGKILRSKTGYHWVVVRDEGEGTIFRGVARMDGRWVFVGEKDGAGYITSSPNLKRYIDSTPVGSKPFHDAHYFSNFILAVSDDGEYWTSLDGKNWTEMAAGAAKLTCVIEYGSSSDIAIGSEDGNVYTAWSRTSTPSARATGLTAPIQKVTYNTITQRLVAIADGEVSVAGNSTGSMAWTVSATNLEGEVGDLWWDGEKYYATSVDTIYTSADAITWAPVGV